MFQLKISKAEIQLLKYESYCCPCPSVKKYKQHMGMRNKIIGDLTGLNLETVGD